MLVVIKLLARKLPFQKKKTKREQENQERNRGPHQHAVKEGNFRSGVSAAEVFRHELQEGLYEGCKYFFLDWSQKKIFAPLGVRMLGNN